MDFNKDTRQVTIDSDLYNALRVLAFQGANTEQEKQRLSQIDRHALKFNVGLRIARDATAHELENSTRDIIRQERRAHSMSSNRHKQTLYVKTFGGRWIPVRVTGFDRGSPFILHVDPLVMVGQTACTWAMQADHVLYEHELVKIIEASETPDEILRYTRLMEEHRVKSSV